MMVMEREIPAAMVADGDQSGAVAGGIGCPSVKGLPGRRPGRRGNFPAERNGVRMQIQSTRFGWLSVDDSRIMTFPRGLLGFPTHKRFALIQTNSENYFFWLQSIDDPALAFVVTDPGIFFKDYDVPVREETVTELELDEPEFLQTFTICNRVGEWLTGNLLGPLLVNSKNRLATQVVLTEKKWTTRQPLLKLEAQMPLAKSA
jgi:flagellar assembly factor FliW